MAPETSTREDPGAPAPVTVDAPDGARTERPWWRRGTVLRDGHVLRWWKELVFVGLLYFVYESVRNANEGGQQLAYENALRVMDWQQALGINHEAAIQDWSLRFEPFIVASNYFYGGAYVAVTLFAVVWLYRRHPSAYPLWRNTLVIATFLALLGFRFFPLMPPRWLDRHLGESAYGFVDTLVQYPTFWSFQSGTMHTISNQFAAMPSLHCGWALWVCCAMYPRVRSTWARVLLVGYVVATVVTVVVTGNHYLLDAVGGFAVVGAGYVLARVFTRAGRGRPVGGTADGDELVLDDDEAAPADGIPDFLSGGPGAGQREAGEPPPASSAASR